MAVTLHMSLMPILGDQIGEREATLMKGHLDNPAPVASDLTKLAVCPAIHVAAGMIFLIIAGLHPAAQVAGNRVSGEVARVFVQRG